MNTELRGKVRETMKARLRQAKIELDAAGAEYFRLYANHEKRTWPASKKKQGRPSIWRGIVGVRLVMAVEKIRADDEAAQADCDADKVHYISLAQAIRRAVKTDSTLRGQGAIQRLSDRAPQARYQQAADCFSRVRNQVFDKELENASERLDAAIRDVEDLWQFLDEVEE
jgi:hypothetical protein